MRARLKSRLDRANSSIDNNETEYNERLEEYNIANIQLNNAAISTK